MWEKLTPDDIARAKHELSLTRAATLSRHAAELKVLDTQQEEIDKFERLVAAFTQRYLDTETSQPQPSEEQPIESNALEEHPNPAVAVSSDSSVSEPATSEAQQEAPSTGLAVVQQVSPNFGIPLRRAVGH
jgi:ATP-dependent exoDNAse (exonuclease V) beta subunit